MGRHACQIINLADEMDQDIKQHSFAQLFLIRKDSEAAALNRHRMLVFEDEIMKRSDSVQEVGASRVLTKLGVMEEEAYGFTQNADMGTAIYKLHQLKTRESETKNSGSNLRIKRMRLTRLKTFQGK